MNILKISKETRNFYFKVLGLVPAIFALIGAGLLPTRFPLAFEASGAVMVYANKIDMLTIPIATFIVAGFMGFISKLAVLTHHKNDDDVLVGTISLGLLVFMNLGNFYYMGNALRNTYITGDISLSLGAMACSLVGAVMMVKSLAFPRFAFGGKYGFRCKYSLIDEAKWKETQTFVGKMLKGSGFVLMLIGAYLYSGIMQLLYLPVIIALNVLFCFIYSKKSLSDMELNAALEAERKERRREKFQEKARLQEEASEALESYLEDRATGSREEN